MIANEVVVGDGRMQKALGLERSASAQAARAGAPLPTELYVDYVGYRVRELVGRLPG